MSDFPEFDHAYQTILIKNPNDRFEQLAAQAHFNVYHSDIWRGTARKFAESIVRECAEVISQRTGPKSALDVLEHFGIDESS